MGAREVLFLLAIEVAFLSVGGEHGQLKDPTLKLEQFRFSFDIRENLFTMEVVKSWSRLPRDVVEALYLEAFKVRLDVILNNLI